MRLFLQQHASSVIGALSGWDRLRFRGTLRMLANRVGLTRFISYSHVLFKDFGDYAESLSRKVRAESLKLTESSERPLEHLKNPNVRKEDVARAYLVDSPVKEGLICTLTAVEPCWSYDVDFNQATGKLELAHAYRKCQHIYHYFIHPVFGFMHVRLQTWLPFNLHVCINGREWLGRQMDQAGIGYLRKENCFTWVSDFSKAQELLDQQVSHNYQQTLGNLTTLVNPALKSIIGNYNVDYYWSLEESEWASDILFKSQRELDAIYPSLVHHGMGSFASPDVMRFLGHKVTPQGCIPPQLKLEVLSDYKQRAEGVRIKHRVGSNSVKMYNKQATVLRTEATLNNMRELKSPRTDENGKVYWGKMRKGVADIARRAEVSEAITSRYLQQMAVVQTPVPLKSLSDDLSRGTTWNKRRVRGLNLLGSDATLLQGMGKGEFLIHGFRNSNLRDLLFTEPTTDPKEQKRRSGQITRKMQLLRGHGLIQKVPCTHRYLLTDKGRQLIGILHATREADINKLTKAA
jgi:hypothetical protein